MKWIPINIPNQKEIDSVNREIARDRARDQQRLAFETAILNAAMGR